MEPYLGGQSKTMASDSLGSFVIDVTHTQVHMRAKLCNFVSHWLTINSSWGEQWLDVQNGVGR